MAKVLDFENAIRDEREGKLKICLQSFTQSHGVDNCLWDVLRKQGEGKIPRRFTSYFRNEVAFIFNKRSKITSHAGHLMTRHLSSSLVTQDILDIADFRGRVAKETAVLRRWGITMIIWFYQQRLECKLAAVGFLKLTFRPLALRQSHSS